MIFITPNFTVGKVWIVIPMGLQTAKRAHIVEDQWVAVRRSPTVYRRGTAFLQHAGIRS
jgi:hypothetical protein